MPAPAVHMTFDELWRIGVPLRRPVAANVRRPFASMPRALAPLARSATDLLRALKAKEIDVAAREATESGSSRLEKTAGAAPFASTSGVTMFRREPTAALGSRSGLALRPPPGLICAANALLSAGLGRTANEDPSFDLLRDLPRGCERRRLRMMMNTTIAAATSSNTMMTAAITPPLLELPPAAALESAGAGAGDGESGADGYCAATSEFRVVGAEPGAATAMVCSCVMRMPAPSEATHGPSCARTDADGGGRPGEVAAEAIEL